MIKTNSYPIGESGYYFYAGPRFAEDVPPFIIVESLGLPMDSPEKPWEPVHNLSFNLG